VPASLTTSELRDLVEGVRAIRRMLANPVEKDEMAAEAAPVRAIFMKSVVARTALRAGTVLTASHLAMKKPGTGIPAERMHELIGQTLICSLEPDELLQESHLQPAVAMKI
jgi:N-acetylneuraminate synthase